MEDRNHSLSLADQNRILSDIRDTLSGLERTERGWLTEAAQTTAESLGRAYGLLAADQVAGLRPVEPRDGLGEEGEILSVFYKEIVASDENPASVAAKVRVMENPSPESPVLVRLRLSCLRYHCLGGRVSPL